MSRKRRNEYRHLLRHFNIARMSCSKSFRHASSPQASTQADMKLLQQNPDDSPVDAAMQPTASAGKSHLLVLPGELRNRIYGYVAASVNYGKPRVYVKIYSGRIPLVHQLPKLLGTCRQVRAEAMSVFLRCNTFTFLYYCRNLKNRSALVFLHITSST